MTKKYIVTLSESERTTLNNVIKQLSGTAEKVRRAHILLKADTNGPNWSDSKIAEAFDCSVRTVENVRTNLCLNGFETVLNRKKRQTPPRKKLLNGNQEAQLIAMRLGEPPKGYANWSLRLLANQLVVLEVVESISHETVRRTLKKTG